MSDHLPGRSAREGAGKPLTRAEWKRRNVERQALEVWIETQSYTKVKNALKLRSTDAAREMVQRGERRWEEEEADALTRHKAFQVKRMYEIIAASREGRMVEGDDGELTKAIDWQAVDREFKAHERLARLLGFDAQREGAGVTINNIIAGLPPREDVVDGEVVEPSEQKRLEPPKAAD